MSEPAVAAYAGIIVSDLARSLSWYSGHLDASVSRPEEGWAKLSFQDGSEIELVEGDPARPGLSFPSYGRDVGPAVMPGYGCHDPSEVADGLVVARRLPNWIVVQAPDGLRVVITNRDSDTGSGLVGFRYTSPEAAGQRAFLDRIGSPDPVSPAAAVSVRPVVAAGRDATLTDPDGTTLVLVGSRQGA